MDFEKEIKRIDRNLRRSNRVLYVAIGIGVAAVITAAILLLTH